MNILWLYDQPFKPEAGGTERLSSIIMEGLTSNGHSCLEFLVFDQINRGEIKYKGEVVSNLYNFLKNNKIDVVINQIAFASWLLKDFYHYGGRKWRSEGGKLISCLHFDPKFPSTTISNLLNEWGDFSVFRKSKRVVRILLNPIFNWKERKFHRTSYKYIYENSDTFILLSDKHRHNFQKCSGIKDKKKLQAIFNPLTFPDISTNETLEKKENIILVVSRLHEPQKRISYILRAWKKIMVLDIAADWQLVIIGEGESEQYYKELTKKWRLSRIFFEGHQSPEPYYKKASISLMTSSAEGWGLTLTESLQRGVIPVVMESSPIFREILIDGDTGFIVPNNDLKEFVQKIVFLISNPNKRTEMAKNALIDSERFSVPNALVLWEQVLLQTHRN